MCDIICDSDWCRHMWGIGRESDKIQRTRGGQSSHPCDPVGSGVEGVQRHVSVFCHQLTIFPPTPQTSSCEDSALPLPSPACPRGFGLLLGGAWPSGRAPKDRVRGQAREEEEEDSLRKGRVCKSHAEDAQCPGSRVGTQRPWGDGCRKARSMGRHGDPGPGWAMAPKGTPRLLAHQFCLPCVADIRDAPSVEFYRA